MGTYGLSQSVGKISPHEYWVIALVVSALAAFSLAAIWGGRIAAILSCALASFSFFALAVSLMGANDSESLSAGVFVWGLLFFGFSVVSVMSLRVFVYMGWLSVDMSKFAKQAKLNGADLLSSRKRRRTRIRKSAPQSGSPQP
jgi:prepilin signal peptidase PulO-like enzyme (type II secretory pathway)